MNPAPTTTLPPLTSYLDLTAHYSEEAAEELAIDRYLLLSWDSAAEAESQRLEDFYHMALLLATVRREPIDLSELYTAQAEQQIAADFSSVLSHEFATENESSALEADYSEALAVIAQQPLTIARSAPTAHLLDFYVAEAEEHPADRSSVLSVSAEDESQALDDFYSEALVVLCTQKWLERVRAKPADLAEHYADEAEEHPADRSSVLSIEEEQDSQLLKMMDADDFMHTTGKQDFRRTRRGTETSVIDLLVSQVY